MMATPLDPIWEFVFDDYDSAGSTGGRGRRKRMQQQNAGSLQANNRTRSLDVERQVRFQLPPPKKEGRQVAQEEDDRSFIERLLSGSSQDEESTPHRQRQKTTRNEQRDDDDELQIRSSWSLTGSFTGNTTDDDYYDEKIRTSSRTTRKGLFGKRKVESFTDETPPDRRATSVDSIFDTMSTKPVIETRPQRNRRSIFPRKEKAISESPTRRRSLFGGRGQSTGKEETSVKNVAPIPNSSRRIVASESPSRRTGLLPRKKESETVDWDEEGFVFHEIMASLGLSGANVGGGTVKSKARSEEVPDSRRKGTPKSLLPRRKPRQQQSTRRRASETKDKGVRKIIKDSQSSVDISPPKKLVPPPESLSQMGVSKGRDGMAGVEGAATIGSGALIASALSNQQRKESIQRSALDNIRSVDTSDVDNYGYDTSFLNVSMFDPGEDSSSVVSLSAPSSIPPFIPPSRHILPIEQPEGSDFWALFNPSDETDGALSEFSATTDEFSDHESTHSSVGGLQVSSNKEVRDLMEEPSGHIIAANNVTALATGTDLAAGRAALRQEKNIIKWESDDSTLITEANSVLDENELNRREGKSAQIRDKISMVACCRMRSGDKPEDLLRRDEQRRKQSSIPVEEFIEPTNVAHFESAFPRVKMVADNDSSSRKIVEGRRPIAQEQFKHAAIDNAELKTLKGPQSVYSYDYESGTHMAVRYDFFSDNPMECVTVHSFSTPPIVRVAPNDVVVEVEASTVSSTDCRIRRGELYGDDTLMLPITPGIDVVGRLVGLDLKTSKKYKIKNGERVMSLTKWGGNSRFRRIEPKQLVRVPDGAEPAEAACLAETYLSAYQMLHHTQRSGLRHKRDALGGKSVMVLGALTNLGRATIELANVGGATFVYAPCKDKQRNGVREIGGTPLRQDMAEWLPHLEGKIDIIIDATGILDVENMNRALVLHDRGAYFFVGAAANVVDQIVEKWTGKAKIVACTGRKNKNKLSNQIQGYDVFDSWKNNLETCKRDLSQLLKLLRRGVIRPRVLDRIPLDKVARAQEIVASKKLQGYLVCEPWIKSVQRAVLL